MELVKLNEAYNIVDELENGWKVQGQAIQELNGNIRINISINIQEKHIGSYNYEANANSENIHMNMSCNKDAKNDFAVYCQKVTEGVLTQLEKNKE